MTRLIGSHESLLRLQHYRCAFHAVRPWITRAFKRAIRRLTLGIIAHTFMTI
jgi:hypothetical protein